MGKTLIIIGIVVVVTGLAWPYLVKLGLGSLPGDLAFKKGNVSYHIPLMTSFLVSVVLSFILYIFRKF
jgi:hypothetical protein